MNEMEYEEIDTPEIEESNSYANDYDEFILNSIREKIEAMSKFNQVEVLRILTKYKEVTINENKYGIHINLNDLPNALLQEIETYITYVNTQELELNKREQTKETYKKTFFVKHNKDNSL
jgi:hypothetical protein